MFCLWEDVGLGSPEQQKKSFKMPFGAYVELIRKLMSLLEMRTHKGHLNIRGRGRKGSFDQSWDFVLCSCDPLETLR